MSSASAITPTHVPSASLKDADDVAVVVEDNGETEWPTLSGDNASARPNVDAADSGDDWELLNNSNAEDATRSPTVVRIVEPESKGGQSNNLSVELKHCASSPDFRHLTLEESSGSSSSSSSQSGDSAVLVDSNDISVASSGVVVQAPGKAAPWGGSVSFKDTLLKNGGPQKKEKPQEEQIEENHRRHHHKRKTRKQPSLVVKSIPRPKSTGDLMRMELIVENDGEPMGDTDAQDWYDRKEHGYVTSKARMKLRPDEQGRLIITQNKKIMQAKKQGILTPERLAKFTGKKLDLN